MQRKLYGLEPSQDLPKESILRDIRTPLERYRGLLLSRPSLAFYFMTLSFFIYSYPGFWLIGLILYAFLTLWRLSSIQYEHLPMRLPEDYPGLDYNSPKPGSGYKKAQGMFYLGNDHDQAELWIGKDDVLTHMLVLGTTGAGKTETLVSLCYNYLACGSGLIYVDPKASPKLGVQLWTLARMLGRDDDFLLINYMSEKLKIEAQACRKVKPIRESNTQNPFAVGNANQLTQLLLALMPSDDKSANSIFAANAQALISGLMFVLVERRDLGIEELSIESIRTYLMDVSKIDALARDEKSYSEVSRQALQSGLATVGWDKNKALSEQSKNFPEQFGYARSYFGRALSLLIDNYGHIFRASQGEVDVQDVILNRRILVNLIPSMDKDPKELKSLGQICLAQIKNACAIGLGSQIQGRLSQVLGALPTEAKTPFGVIVDEYAAIETPGFEILLTQGRGLGIAVLVASQDFAGIKRASSEAAEQIVSNCKTKLFMTSEDPKDTTELVQKLAGKGYVMKSSGLARPYDFGQTYIDNRAVVGETLEKVDFRDLQKQVEGDVTISFKGEIIRGRTFYANPPLNPWQEMRLHYQLQCRGPDSHLLELEFGELHSLLEAFIARASLTLSQRDQEEIEKSRDGKLNHLAKLLSLAYKDEYLPSDIAIGALVAYEEEDQEELSNFLNSTDDYPDFEEFRPNLLASRGEEAINFLEEEKEQRDEVLAESSLTEERGEEKDFFEEALKECGVGESENCEVQPQEASYEVKDLEEHFSFEEDGLIQPRDKQYQIGQAIQDYVEETSGDLEKALVEKEAFEEAKGLYHLEGYPPDFMQKSGAMTKGMYLFLKDLLIKERK